MSARSIDGSGRVGKRVGGTQFVLGRNRMTVDPRIPTMPGRGTSGFHQPGGGGAVLILCIAAAV